MPEDEKTLDYLESRIPLISGQAFAAANIATLAAGHPVTNSAGGVVYRVLPDGTRQEIKKIDPPVTVSKGTKIKLS